MSSKKVLVVTCDRCGRKEHLEQVQNSPLDEINFEHLGKDWGDVRYQGNRLDLCPLCNEQFKAFFSDFANVNKPKIGGPLDETR